MNKKIRWITETAVMLALLVCLQALTKPLTQLVTGSCVNTVLAVSALLGGLSCGLGVALVSLCCHNITTLHSCQDTFSEFSSLKNSFVRSTK